MGFVSALFAHEECVLGLGGSVGEGVEDEPHRVSSPPLSCGLGRVIPLGGGPLRPWLGKVSLCGGMLLVASLRVQDAAFRYEGGFFIVFSLYDRLGCGDVALERCLVRGIAGFRVVGERVRAGRDASYLVDVVDPFNLSGSYRRYVLLNFCDVWVRVVRIRLFFDFGNGECISVSVCDPCLVVEVLR